MSEPENFISRWSRRKLEAERTADAGNEPQRSADTLREGEPAAIRNDSADASPPSPMRDDERDEGSGLAPRPDEPAFDPATLPPVDSISAGTDIRAFLQTGVPAELKRAALRRAWTADPAIRDFIEVAENQWDFTAENGVPGFGPLKAIDDVGRMVAEITGEVGKLAERKPEPQPQPQTPSTADKPSTTAAPVARPAEQLLQEQSKQETVLAEESPRSGAAPQVDVAMQHEHSQAQYEEGPGRRGHGRALPE